MVSSTKTITTKDGVQSELRIFEHANAEIVVLVLPAMGVRAKYYDDLAESFNKQGFSVCVAELRGIDTSSVRASRDVDFGYYELTAYDVPSALTATQESFPNSKVVLFGHSLGGQVTSLMLAQKPDCGAHALVLSASCSICYKGWPWYKRLNLLLFTQLAALIAQVFGYFPGKKIGFGGQEARTVMRDWAHVARNGKYRLRNTDFDYEVAFSSVTLPVLAINYEDDKFAPYGAVSRLVDKFGNQPVSRLTMTGQDLGTQKADHFNWVKHPDKVVSETALWLRRLA